MDTFSGYHPLINFTYFVIVIGLSMFYMHPVFLALSLIGSVSYSIYLKGRKTVKVFLLGMLPVCLLAAAANPLFSHAGATMLFYLKTGKYRIFSFRRCMQNNNVPNTPNKNASNIPSLRSNR